MWYEINTTAPCSTLRQIHSAACEGQTKNTEHRRQRWAQWEKTTMCRYCTRQHTGEIKNTPRMLLRSPHLFSNEPMLSLCLNTYNCTSKWTADAFFFFILTKRRKKNICNNEHFWLVSCYYWLATLVLGYMSGPIESANCGSTRICTTPVFYKKLKKWMHELKW